MSLVYNITAINDRLQGVVTAIDAGGGNGSMQLLAGGTVVSTISLTRPCGTVNGGILTFSGTLLDPSAANTGVVDGTRFKDSTGSIIISGLTVGIPLASADVIISNGLNSTLISAGQSVQVLSATIQGS